ncbi:uncharacterized protein [Haliotis cracherodii]|uniref:uncharacterized protein n=1 Tax=Haliotis cracherodii TaxID=6455 RepID=UPI0039EB6055
MAVVLEDYEGHSVVDCGFPPYKDGAMVDYVKTTFGAEANSFCVKGYSSSGTGTSVCLSNGTWSQTDLVCTARSHSTWQRVAKTTASTTPILQRFKLNAQISAACKPKLRVKADFKLSTKVMDLHSNDVQSLWKIWGQSVRGLSKSSWDSFEIFPKREFELFLSDAQNTHLSVDDDGNARKNRYDGDFVWFVKDDQCVSTSSANDIGSVLTSLFEGEIDPNFDTYEVDDSNSTVYGQVTGHMSQDSQPSFTIPCYWFVKKQGTSGKVDIIRWSVAGGFLNAEPRSVTMPWCPDTCWHHAFDTRASSSNKHKHIRHLTNGVQHGHNIMVKVGNVIVKAREVVLHDGHVTVSIKEFWVPSDKNAFSSGSRQAWIMASTTGRDVQCIHVPESAVVEDVTEGGKPSIWFLDSRQWEKVFTIDGTGAVLSGSMSDLLNKVNEGRSLRVGVLHTNGMYKALEVDAVDVSSTGHIAGDIIHNVDLVLGPGNDFHFTDTCGVVSSIITTEGSYKTYRYNIGSAGKHSIVNDVAKIDWFIEM